MSVVNNRGVSRLMKDCYSSQQLQELLSLLQRHSTFEFPALDNGLYPASNLRQEASYTGYSYVWVRDNVYVACAHALNHRIEPARKTTDTLMRYFIQHRWRLERIIAGELDPSDPMNRPHIRFNGEDLSEINQKWAHAENDALGYFLWLFCRLHAAPDIALAPEEREVLTLFAFYLEAIRYWEDEDSGHWEEARKVEASSIGVAMAGLRELRRLIQNHEGSRFAYRDRELSGGLLDRLIAQGDENLKRILPAECIQSDPAKNRRYDAALLFLVFPTNAVGPETADRILLDVAEHLQGEYGVRRYLGDSYWAPDYKVKLRPEERTIDVSDNMASRDRLAEPGLEAQWCVFDPILSIIHGVRYRNYRLPEDLRSQTQYFNRALGQLTAENSPFGGCKCPELYYLEDGQFVPNDTVPLLWTQANLWMAFKFMEDSAKLAGER